MYLCACAITGNALDATVNAVVKNSARRAWRRERLLHPEKEADYAQAVFHCAEAFFSVKPSTIRKGFRIALTSSTTHYTDIELPTRAKLRSGKNNIWKPQMPYITDGDVRKIKYQPRVIISHPTRRGIGEKATKSDCLEIVKKVKEAQELLKVSQESDYCYSIISYVHTG